MQEGEPIRVIPAQAGIQEVSNGVWAPAYAGVTKSVSQAAILAAIVLPFADGFNEFDAASVPSGVSWLPFQRVLEPPCLIPSRGRLGYMGSSVPIGDDAVGGLLEMSSTMRLTPRISVAIIAMLTVWLENDMQAWLRNIVVRRGGR